MSERNEITISSRALLVVLTVGCVGCLYLGSFLGEKRGELRMKRWQDDWYQRNPVVKEVPDYDSLPLGKQIHDCLSAGKTWVTRAQGTFFTVGCDIDVWDPPPLPKPQKGSKRQKGDIAVIGDHLAPSCKHFPTYDECQYEIVARPVETKP